MTWNALAGFHWLTLERQSGFFHTYSLLGRLPQLLGTLFRGCSSLGDLVGEDSEKHSLLYLHTSEITFVHLKDIPFLSSPGYCQMLFPQGPRAVSWCPPEPLSPAVKLFGSQSAPACSGEEIFSFPIAGPWIKELNSAGPSLGPAVHPGLSLPAGLCAPPPNPWGPTIFTDFSPLYYPLP